MGDNINVRGRADGWMANAHLLSVLLASDASASDRWDVEDQKKNG